MLLELVQLAVYSWAPQPACVGELAAVLGWFAIVIIVVKDLMLDD